MRKQITADEQKGADGGGRSKYHTKIWHEICCKHLYQMTILRHPMTILRHTISLYPIISYNFSAILT